MKRSTVDLAKLVLMILDVGLKRKEKKSSIPRDLPCWVGILVIARGNAIQFPI
jgi:hypothetical protein